MKKGDCIIVACRNVCNNRDWLFCYAYVSGSGKLKGTRILHAWNEVNNIVFDFSNGKKVWMSKQEYYDLAEVKEHQVTKQTSKEVVDLMLKYKSYGGWIKSKA